MHEEPGSPGNRGAGAGRATRGEPANQTTNFGCKQMMELGLLLEALRVGYFLLKRLLILHPPRNPPFAKILGLATVAPPNLKSAPSPPTSVFEWKFRAETKPGNKGRKQSCRSSLQGGCGSDARARMTFERYWLGCHAVGESAKVRQKCPHQDSNLGCRGHSATS